jgi:hypothetical protein
LGVHVYCSILATNDVDLVFGDYDTRLVLIHVAGIEYLGLLALGKCSSKYILSMKSNPGKPA